MTEVQLFPQVRRNRWTEEELGETLRGASPHVRFLLRELSEKEEIRASELKSKRVSYAITQRICNSSNRDSLVFTREDPDSGQKIYFLNAEYRSLVRPLVADAEEPPPTPERPPRPKTPRARSSRRGKMSATDGIADPHGVARVRQIAQTSAGRSVLFPPGTDLAYCQELLAFLNSTSTVTQYRIVLDTAGPRLEVAY